MTKLSLPPYVDSSMLNAWRSCKRKFFWSYVNSLYPTGKSVHLVAGGAFAAGMEAARRVAFQDPGAHRPSHHDLLQAAYPAFLREWGDYEAPENSTKSLDNTFSALSEYLEKYPPQEDVVKPALRPDGRPAVEFTFSIPLEEGPTHPETQDPFLFVGRFDLLGDYNGLPCIVDEKTTSAIGFTWGDQWRLRGQFMGYCWACQQLGYPVNTAVVRGIGILKREFKFATAIEQYPQHLITRWYQMMIRDLEDIVEAYQYQDKLTKATDWAFPYNFGDACSSYGGCAFATLCAAQDPEPFKSNFISHRFNPLQKTPVKEEAA